MKIELKEALSHEKEILTNLLEKYNYEFSQYDKVPFDQQGLYHYPYLDHYWTDHDRQRYFIVKETKILLTVQSRWS